LGEGQPLHDEAADESLATGRTDLPRSTQLGGRAARSIRTEVSNSRRRVGASPRFYLLFSLTILLLLGFEAFLASVPFAEAIPDYSQELQKRQLDAYFEMIKLLITLATLALGGITGYVINRDRAIGLAGGQLRRVIASWTLCAASLYFGYLAYQQVVWMLNNGFFNPFNPRVWIPTRAQFWSFLACIVVFADFVYGSLHSCEPGKTGACP
jgi:hypothetical protein